MNNIIVTGAVSYDGLLYVTIVQEEISLLFQVVFKKGNEPKSSEKRDK